MTNTTLRAFSEMGSALAAETGDKWGVFVNVKVRGPNGVRVFESCKMFDVSEARAKDSAKFYTGGFARPMGK